MWKSGNEIRVTYALNAEIAPEWNTSKEEISEGNPGVALNNIENPSKCITNLELKSGKLKGGGDVTYNKDFFDPRAWGSGSTEGASEGSTTVSADTYVSKDQHGENRSVYLFADGHTKVHAFKDTWNPGKRNWYAPREAE